MMQDAPQSYTSPGLDSQFGEIIHEFDTYLVYEGQVLYQIKWKSVYGYVATNGNKYKSETSLTVEKGFSIQKGVIPPDFSTKTLPGPFKGARQNPRKLDELIVGEQITYPNPVKPN